MSSTSVLEATSELFIWAGNHLHTYILHERQVLRTYDEGTQVHWEQHHHLLCAQEIIALQQARKLTSGN